nr:response regulator transcription factor [Desulfurispira natronophila]
MLLNAQGDMTILAQAGSAAEAMELLKQVKPDLIILDINLPDKNGMELAEGILRKYGLVKVLFLTMHDEPEYVSRVLEIGASGYMLKNAADTELINAIRSVMHGEFALHRGLTDNIARQKYRKFSKENIAVAPPKASLSKRESEVLCLITLGHTQQEVADQLGISIKTVETHKSNIMDALGTRKRSDLVKYALAHGLINAYQP